MITGTVGFTLLLLRRRIIRRRNRLSIPDWLCVFLTFFWSRELFNFLGWILSYVLHGQLHLRGDEAKLSLLLLPATSGNALIDSGWFGLTAALLATFILLHTTFKILPRQQRLTFIAAGLAGSTAGYMFWFGFAGPLLLP